MKYDRIIIIVYYITVEQQKVLMSIYEEISKTQQNSQKSSYKNFGLNEKHQKSHSLKPIQLQVNISIGKNKYLLQVQKCSNLHEEVQQFLKIHGINLKYEGPILTMVREQLTKKDIQKENKYKQKDNGQIDQLKQVKHQIDHRKKVLLQIERKEEVQQKQQINELWNQNNHQKVKKINLSDLSNKQNKQNYPSQYNSTKHGSSIEAPGLSHVFQNVKQPITQIKEDELKCQNVYQRWKVKEKIKETEKAKNVIGQNKNKKQKISNRSFIKQKQQEKQGKSQGKTKSISQKKLEVHSPDYFYNKGKKFQELKQENIKQIYKQKYPFQIHKDSSITPSKKRQLHEKLYKEHKSREEIKMDKKLKEQIAQRPKHFVLPTDKYKKRVIQRDNKLNEALSYLLENKMIQNPYKIERVSKSPFRKTNF